MGVRTDVLSSKRRRFVNEYLIDYNGTQAAIRAGYSKSGASVTGCRLLSNGKISAAVEAGKLALAKRSEVTQEYVINVIKDTIEKCRGDDEHSNPAAVLKGTELLGKHLGLFTDQVKLTGNMAHDWTVKIIKPEGIDNG